MSTIAITGTASGLGAATSARLRDSGHGVIGVDVQGADINADLGVEEGRRTAIAAVSEACGGVLDGLVTFAGVAGATSRPGSLLVSVNYFGTVQLLEGLRPVLAAAAQPAAIAVSSNSSTCQPGFPVELVDLCLAGDEGEARAKADRYDSVGVYPATKTAIARWVRRHAPTDEWAGSGILLNAIAPGMIDTPMVEETRRDPVLGPLIGQFPLPVGRTGRAEEIAALVAFLLGPEARFFCGSVVFIDGGTDALLRPDDWPAPWQLPAG